MEVNNSTQTAPVPCPKVRKFVKEVARMSLYGDEAKDATSFLLAMNYVIRKARAIDFREWGNSMPTS